MTKKSGEISPRSVAPLNIDVAQAFRGAMRRLAATVTIVTARQGDEWFGMTMTAVTSLSMDPPTLLICVNRKTRLHAVLAAVEGASFCVNLLRPGHEEAASAFGGSVEPTARFGIGEWACEDGAPYLVDAQSNLFCDVTTAIAYGSHTIFIGAVRQVRLEGDVAPLIYGDGRYLPFSSDVELPH
ncbi:flavin reductase family protein [Sphingobium sp. Sx8-8]|uniref:flavin reductase family protein n=1 Tax=Sphingobium sp. Sx8-8 TaxID=2933617 RepID=UPI001F5887DD|nr:flavin reductase family protein [Sphingobium sp. Sx8-8]